jgi:hypothetical protein
MSHPTVIPRPDRSELAHLSECNTIAALCRYYGVSDHTIRNWLRAYGIVHETLANAVTRRIQATVTADWLQARAARDVRDIAAELGCAPLVVYQLYHRFQVRKVKIKAARERKRTENRECGTPRYGATGRLQAGCEHYAACQDNAQTAAILPCMSEADDDLLDGFARLDLRAEREEESA